MLAHALCVNSNCANWSLLSRDSQMIIANGGQIVRTCGENCKLLTYSTFGVKIVHTSGENRRAGRTSRRGGNARFSRVGDTFYKAQSPFCRLVTECPSWVLTLPFAFIIGVNTRPLVREWGDDLCRVCAAIFLKSVPKYLLKSMRSQIFESCARHCFENGSQLCLERSDRSVFLSQVVL